LIPCGKLSTLLSIGGEIAERQFLWGSIFLFLIKKCFFRANYFSFYDWFWWLKSFWLTIIRDKACSKLNCLDLENDKFLAFSFRLFYFFTWS
jgi:hypothetical protein